MPTESNRREFTRVPMQVAVEVTSTQGNTTTHQVKDVSLNGLYLQCKKPLPLGADCRVTFFLGERENPIRIEASGKVVRVDPAGMGLEITAVVGVESFEHLRNLVLYNSSDTDQVEQEFHDHIGIKRRV